MASSMLHDILGGGGDSERWKALSAHSHSFLYASVDDKGQVQSVHELALGSEREQATSH